MAKPQRPKIVFARVTPELHREVKTAATAADTSITGWVHGAVVRRLAESGYKEVGPLAGLPPADQRRVERYIRLLRSTDDEALKRAIDANFMLLERATKKNG